jgi:aldose sugar dehydrogenase
MTLCSAYPLHRDGMDDPRMFWVPSISTSSLSFCIGDKFPLRRNNMLAGALNGLSLQRVAFNQPSQAERREPMLGPLNIRILDVQQSPDGYIYDADGTILRLEPMEGS